MTTASDNFNRADALTLGGSWTTQTSAPNSMQIVSNKAGPQGGVGAGGQGEGNYWSADSFTGDHFSQATFTGTLLPDVWGAVRVRCSASADTYYSGGIDVGDNGDSRRRIWKTVAGTRTQLQNEPVDIALGDVVYLEAVGTDITLKINGVVSCTVSDSAISGGSPGIGSRSSSAGPGASSFVMEDWSGGDVGAVATVLDEDGEWIIVRQDW